MPIGNSPDLPEYDKEREMGQREMNIVYKWWDSLSEEEQYNLMLDYYPNDFMENDADDVFDDLSSDDKLRIWRSENKLTEEDIEGQKDIAGDFEYEERKLRGDYME